MVFSLAICCPGRLIVLRELHGEGLTLVEHVFVVLLVYLTLGLVNELLADFDTFAIPCLLMLVGSRSNFELLVLWKFKSKKLKLEKMIYFSFRQNSSVCCAHLSSILSSISSSIIVVSVGAADWTGVIFSLFDSCTLFVDVILLTKYKAKTPPMPVAAGTMYGCQTGLTKT